MRIMRVQEEVARRKTAVPGVLGLRQVMRFVDIWNGSACQQKNQAKVYKQLNKGQPRWG